MHLTIKTIRSQMSSYKFQGSAIYLFIFKLITGASVSSDWSTYFQPIPASCSDSRKLGVSGHMDWGKGQGHTLLRGLI